MVDAVDSNDESPSTGNNNGGTNGGAIVGVVLAVAAIMVLVGVVIVKRKHRTSQEKQDLLDLFESPKLEALTEYDAMPVSSPMADTVELASPIATPPDSVQVDLSYLGNDLAQS